MYSWSRVIMVAVLGFICLGSTACSFPPQIYRMDIQQGNMLTPEMIASIKKGMSKEQVQDILGTPALSHTLNTDRWDYYYFFKSGTKKHSEERHFTVYFRNGRVSHWQ